MLTSKTFTCSKPSIEALDLGVKYGQNQQQRQQNNANEVVLVSLLLSLTTFYNFL